jgi:carbon-monoxide dehydrogenase large subunit
MTVDAVAGAGARPTLVGASIPRLEDDRLLTGRARYVADVRLPGMLEVAFVRSQLAHARIEAVHADDARAVEGVVGVFTAADLVDVSPVPDFPDWAKAVATFPLCRDRVRYVGAPIACVVAADRYAAEDAAELVYAELDPLPVVTTIGEALAADAPRLFPDWPDNRVVDAPPELERIAPVFERLRVVSQRVAIQRHGAVPMETRGAAAEWRDDRLTVWSATQFPHIARTMLHYVLGIPEREIRVIAPDVGGGFGGKAQIYGEEYVVAWLARHLGRPVRWIEDRYEHMIAAVQARDVEIELDAAVHADGRIEALRGTVYQDCGSGEAYPNGYNPAFVAVGSLTGPYRIPDQDVGVVAAVTNKTPSGAYRGFGIPEACFAMERLLDTIARELELDPFELRRSMLLSPEELPYETAAGAIIDSGSHREAFELALERGRAAYEEVKARLAGQPRLRVGFGVASYVEGVAATYFGTTGHWTSQDAADIRFDPDGGVTVSVGVSTTGQALKTMVATVLAETLGLRLDQIRVVMGDTDTCPYGLGSWASRSTVVAAGAIVRAAEAIQDKARRIAAHMLEVAPEDLVFADGLIHVQGSRGRAVSWQDVAQRALIRTLELPPGVEPGLEAKATYDPPGIQHVPDERGRMNSCPTYTNASHAAVVSVDVATGIVRVEHYVVVHDCGRVLNPLIVAGQVHGGTVQGIAGTLLEEFAYDESGQPLSTMFKDYLLPSAADSPPIELHELESPAPEIPYGVKGAGESGIIGPAAAIAQGVEMALAEFGIQPIASTPLSPGYVVGLLEEAPAARGTP